MGQTYHAILYVKAGIALIVIATAIFSYFKKEK